MDRVYQFLEPSRPRIALIRATVGVPKSTKFIS